MHSDGLSIPQSHSAWATSTRGGRGRLGLLLYPYSPGIVFVCVYLVIYDLHHPDVRLYYTVLQRCTKRGRDRNPGCRPCLSQTDPGKLATLCLLSGDVGSRLALPRCHHRHCHPYRACGGPKPLEENLLPQRS